MQQKIFLLLFIVFSVTLLNAQTKQDKSLVMTRCDKDEKILPSPEHMNLKALEASFDPNVDTVLMIHGYLNDFDNSKKNFKKAIPIWKAKLGKRNYVGFHWPSKVLWFGTGIKNADKASKYLLYILSKITQWYGNREYVINVVSHSLGGRLTLRTLTYNEARYFKLKCFFMAPAVHNDAYINSFANTNEIPIKNYVYYSDRDGILKYLYSIYYWLFGKDIYKNSVNYKDYQKFDNLTLPEKIEYLKKLDKKINEDQESLSELDNLLGKLMKRAKQSAMGLTGSVPANKVQNVNVTKWAGSHFYWSNKEVLKKVGDMIK